jgi:SnoaL-like polyketide cyclase
MTDTHGLVQRLHALFNARELEEAATLFADDAVVEHGAPGRQKRGGTGYLEFARMWIGAFPDAVLTVEAITPRNPTTIEVDLLATGTHEGPLDLGGYGLFKPSGTDGKLRLRQIVELKDGLIVYSAMSYDVQDIVQQLTVVSVPKLLEHLKRVRQLGDRLAQTAPEQVVERRSLIDRLGTELDAARRIVRPYFDR